jgi:hemerythrin-like domain-containing protein
MGSAIAELEHEHEAILFSLGILDAMGIRALQGGRFSAAEALELVAFLKEFADTCHHGKEEGILFPAMELAGVAKEGGPIGAMLQEHEIGRGLWRRMDAALRGSIDAGAFARAAAEYSAFLRLHIEKENGILFPMGERLLPEDRQREISAAFQEHEETVMGAGRHEELHAMLDRFGKDYPGAA